MKKSIYIISVLCAAAIFCVSCVSTPSEEPAQDVVSESESLQQDVLPPEQGAAGNQVVSDAANDNFLEENVPSEEEDNQEKEESPASSLPALSDDKPVINLSVGVGPSGVTRSGTHASSLGKEKNGSEQKKSLSNGTSQNRTAALSSADASDESAAADFSGANSSGVQNETDMTDDISAELVLEEAPGDFDIVYDEPEVVSVPEEMADEDEINKRDTAVAEAADAKDESAVDEIATVPEEIAAGNESDRRDTAVAEAADAKEGSAVDEIATVPEEIAAGNEIDRRDTAVAEASDVKDESAADEAAAEPQKLAAGEDTERDTTVAEAADAKEESTVDEIATMPEEIAAGNESDRRDTAVAEASDAKDESAVDEIATVTEEIAAGNESDRRDTAVAEASDVKDESAVDEIATVPEEIAAGNESDRRDTAVAEASDAKDESAADEAAAEPQELAAGEDTERDTAVAAVVIPEVIDPDEAVIDETDSLAESEMEDDILFDEPSVVVVSSEEENSDVRNVDFSSEEEQKNSDPVISRSVEMQLGQSLELVYPGQGWIYIGELDTAQPLLSYSGCEKKYRDTVFTLTSQRTGTSLLQFVKKDILADAYIRDYLEVIVSGPYDDDISTTLVTAPSYAEIIPANQDYVLKAHRRQNSAILVGSENRGVYYNTPEVDVKSKIDTSEGDGVPAGAAVPQEPQKIGVDRDDVQEALTAEPGSIVQQENTEESSAQPSVSDLFAQAQQAYNSKDYETAASCINSFIKNSTQRLDEALYLKGLIFEAKSGIQNVKIALSAYKAVVNGWPESSVWNSANERAIYLERFYFNIR